MHLLEGRDNPLSIFVSSVLKHRMEVLFGKLNKWLDVKTGEKRQKQGVNPGEYRQGRLTNTQALLAMER